MADFRQNLEKRNLIGDRDRSESVEMQTSTNEMNCDFL